MSDTPKPWNELDTDGKLERLRDADRDLWNHFDHEIYKLHERIVKLETPEHFSTRGAIFALQSRLDDLCRKLEAMCKALSS